MSILSFLSGICGLGCCSTVINSMSLGSFIVIVSDEGGEIFCGDLVGDGSGLPLDGICTG